MAVIVYQGGPWIHQFLRWAGIPEDKIVHASETPTLIRILHVPTPNPCLFSQGIYLRAMRDYVLSRMKPVLGKFFFIYCSFYFYFILFLFTSQIIR